MNVSLFLLPAAALALGIREKIWARRETEAIPYRVNVNGTRGKSTVTRLLTAALLEAGIPAVGKATGSKSCLLGFREENGSLLGYEVELQRKPEGANINEVRRAIAEAGRLGARVLVAECMAVNPDYQKTYARDFLRCNMTVITNVLEDHMEVLGPELENMAEAFMEAVPEKSTLVVTPGPFRRYFEEAGVIKNVRVLVADSSQVPDGYCERFAYLVFPENVALALAAARALGVEKETALSGMLKALPDAGAIRYRRFRGRGGEGTLISAFAANDPASTMAIWNYLLEKKDVDRETTVLLNCRADRFERGVAFTEGVLSRFATRSLILMGEGTRFIASRLRGLPFEEVVDLGGLPVERVAAHLRGRCGDGDVFLGIGNYLGVDRLFEELQGGMGVG